MIENAIRRRADDQERRKSAGKHPFVWDGRGRRGEDARYSILPGRAATDLRLTQLHFRLLAYLGRFNQKKGWCRLSQTDLAETFGVRRQAVNKATGELVGWGYLDKQSQGQSGESFCLYRTIIDGPEEITGVSATPDTPHDEVVSSKPDRGVRAAQTRVSPLRTPNKDHVDHVDQAPPSPSQAKGANAHRLKSELPEDWSLPDAWREWANAHSPGRSLWISSEADKFRDHFHGTAGRKARWEKAWRNWWRKACEAPAPRGEGIRHYDPKASAKYRQQQEELMKTPMIGRYRQAEVAQ